MNDAKFSTLIAILDSLRKEAPNSPEFARFHSKKTEDITFSRGQSFIHLFLLVKFGLETFGKRNEHICDGPNDGGLDGWYISESHKTVYLIQSKFRHSSKDFATTSIPATDLIKMEFEEILEGNVKDSLGTPYNSKVLQFQLALKSGFKTATPCRVFPQWGHTGNGTIGSIFSASVFSCIIGYRPILSQLCYYPN